MGQLWERRVWSTSGQLTCSSRAAHTTSLSRLQGHCSGCSTLVGQAWRGHVRPCPGGRALHLRAACAAAGCCSPQAEHLRPGLVGAFLPGGSSTAGQAADRCLQGGRLPGTTRLSVVGCAWLLHFIRSLCRHSTMADMQTSLHAVQNSAISCQCELSCPPLHLSASCWLSLLLMPHCRR